MLGVHLLVERGSIISRRNPMQLTPNYCRLPHRPQPDETVMTSESGHMSTRKLLPEACVDPTDPSTLTGHVLGITP